MFSIKFIFPGQKIDKIETQISLKKVSLAFTRLTNQFLLFISSLILAAFS